MVKKILIISALIIALHVICSLGLDGFKFIQGKRREVTFEVAEPNSTGDIQIYLPVHDDVTVAVYAVDPNGAEILLNYYEQPFYLGGKEIRK